MKETEFPFFDKTVRIELPKEWKIHFCSPPELPALSAESLRDCFDHPLGTPRLRELARGKKTAALVVEDMTRPTRADKLVPFVMDELKAAGLRRENIVIVSAVGCHKPQTEEEFRKKLGNEIVDQYRTVNPDLFDQLTFVGRTRRGTPLHVFTPVLQTDVKIGVGGILPHGGAGFGGGGKTVMPGICGFETIAHHHLGGLTSMNSPGQIEGNPFREDLEEAARLIHLDFSVNAVIGVDRETVRLFVGDMVEAHRRGVEFARKAYRVDAPREVDLAIINAFPEDHDLLQSTKALCPGMGIDSLNSGGKIFLLSACPDGFGYHLLYGPGGKGYEPFRQEKSARLVDKELIIFSPNLRPEETIGFFPDHINVKVFQEANDAVRYLRKCLPRAKVNVFPFGGMSLLT
jgi:nickel-dependent lactate racemase